MKWISGLLLCLLSTGCALAADVVDLRHADLVNGDGDAGGARVGVCVACHGPEGNAVVPAFPALAGQSAGYLYQSLRGFQRRNDPVSPMTAQVATLDDSALRDVAAYFASRVRHVNVATTDTSGVGANLFRDGDTARGIPPCQGCHGDRAQGHPLAAQVPRFAYYPVLAGQHRDYVAAQLRKFRSAERSDTSNARIMNGVAQNLDDAAIDAIAQWLDAGAR